MILLEGLSASDRAVVRRCSVPDVFDAATYDAVLRGDGRPLADLVALRCIEPTSSTGRRFRVPDPLRRDGLASWWTEAGQPPLGRPVPPVLAELAASLAEVCAEVWPEVALRALIIVDPVRARERFAELFKARDADLNLPGCQDLLDVVTSADLTELAGPELLTFCADRARHLRARTLWLPSLRRTQRYQTRRPIDSALDRLLAGKVDRAVRLHASGGMGKSTSIHWFIAHQCVPARVPCALIDFDFTDVFTVLQHPALILLEWARQLNPQLPDAPFQELLNTFDVVRAALLPTEEERALASLLPPGSATTPPPLDSAEVVDRFREALVEAGDTGPVLVVLDTFEELALRGERLGDLLRMLRVVLDGVPALRLLASGRLTETEQRQARKAPGPRWRQRRLDRFHPQEADRYLRDRRGLTDYALRSVIVERAEGVPWLLGVYADLVTYSPDITTDRLAEIDPEIAWCLDRVVERIDGGLQWFVRYGVVPRRLSRDFAEAVVMPHLRAAIGGAGDDRPDRNPESAQRGTFPTRLVEPDFAALWDRLLDYAAEGSWVSRHESSTVVFQPTFAKPMRRLLEGEGVLARLHEDAATYFVGRAADDAGNAPIWIAEEIYHWLHLNPARAEARWRAGVAASDHLGVIRLCDELLHTDVTPLVSLPWQAAARAERAWAEAVRMRSTERADRWDDVDRDLVSAADLDSDIAEEWAWRAASAASRLAGRDYRGAQHVLPPGNQDEIIVLRSEIESGLGHDEQAWSVLDALAGLPASGVALIDRLASRAGSLLDTEAPLALVRRFGDPALRLAEAMLLLFGGAPDEARRMVRHERSDVAAVVHAAASALAARPVEAVQLLLGRDDTMAVRARARVLRDLRELDQAAEMLDRAQQEALNRRNLSTVLTVLLDNVEFCAFDRKDLRAARRRLDEARRLQVEDGDALRLEELSALLDGDVERLRRLLAQSSGTDRLGVATAVLTLDSSDEFVDALIDTLDRVQPRRARVFWLDDLQRRPEVLPDDRLLEVCSGGEGPLWTLAFAEVVRLTRGAEAALELALPAAAELAPSAPFAWVRYADLAERCGILPPPGAPAELPGFAQYPALHEWYERRTGSAPRTPSGRQVVVNDDLSAWGVRVEVASTDDGRISLCVGGKSAEYYAAGDPLADALLVRGSRDVTRYLAEPQTSLLADRLRLLDREEPRPLRLVTGSARLAAVPWEMFLPWHAYGGWLWRCPADEGPGSPYQRQTERIAAEIGIDGGRGFWSAVRDFDFGADSPLAVLFASDRSSHMSRDISAQPAVHQLQRHGIIVVPGPRQAPAHIVYVQGIMEDTAGLPRVSLSDNITGYGETGFGSPPLNVAALDAWLARAERPPVVVLNVRLPGRHTEQFRQLMLRNDFANQLLQGGNTPAVVATSDEHGTLASLLATAGMTAADLAAGLRRAGETLYLTHLTALFAAVPADALPIVRSHGPRL